MRIVWAIPCGWVRPSSTPGLCDLYDCQKDTVHVAELGTEVEVDVAIRLVGSQADFAQDHTVRIDETPPDHRHQATISVCLLDSN